MTTAVQTVHVVFKTHLDLGFTDLAANVRRAYFEHYIPAALDLAARLREEGAAERFIWTTGSWLIYECLEDGDPAVRRKLEAGIAAGDIAWHALPFTTHTELLEPELLRFGLSLSRELDQRFGRRTIAAKMTDVPGHTRSLVPYLAEAGVKYLHIGVNPASKPPAVPELFVWRAMPGTDVIVHYSKGSYGAAATVPGLTAALAFAHTGDNAGPQGRDAVGAEFARVRNAFPGAQVTASTLDAFAAALLPHKSELPVVTGEIGDTWIHGGGTDPSKVARFRELCRFRAEHEADLLDSREKAAFHRFSRMLLCVPEHTWGMDVKTHLADYVTYDRVAFAAARKADRAPDAPPADLTYLAKFATHARTPRSYSGIEASWNEQREYLRAAVAALTGTRLAGEVSQRMKALEPARPVIRNARKVDSAAAFEFRQFTVRVSPTTGALCGLQARAGGRVWADSTHPLGLFRYQTFNHDDYARWLRDYCVNLSNRGTFEWASADFGKPGLEKAGAASRAFLPTVNRIVTSATRRGERLLVELEMPNDAVATYGAPRRVCCDWRFSLAEPVIELRLQWFAKSATRLPEALWLSFCPAVAEPAVWRMDKLGLPVSPLEVVPDGNRNLHAVGRGVRYVGPDGRVEIETLDTPLLAPGEPRLLQHDNSQPDLSCGWHVNLFNNVWGTNFPQWHEDDGLCRFRLRFGE